MTLMPVSKISVLALEILHRRRCAVDGPTLFGDDVAPAVDRVAEKVEHAAQRPLADRDRHRSTGVERFHSPDHAVGRTERHAPHAATAQVLLHFPRHFDVDAFHLLVDFERVINLGQGRFRKLRVERRPDDLGHSTDVFPVGRFGSHERFRGCVFSLAIIRVRRHRR